MRKRKRKKLSWDGIVLLLLLAFIVSVNAVTIVRYFEARNELDSVRAEHERLLKRITILEKDVRTLETVLETPENGGE